MYQVSSSSTQHGIKSPHGFRTPHRMPVKTGTKEELNAIANQLYPTGRVWHMQENSYFNKLHQGINLMFLRLLQDANLLLEGCFPDSDDFSIDDAAIWEYRLGLNAGTLSFEQRKANILRKMAFPQNVKARLHLNYIQDQLNQAGFSVKLYQNIFFDDNGNVYRKLPSQILELQVGNTFHSDATLHGSGTRHGGGTIDIVANDMFKDNYSVGGSQNLYATFFIAGTTIEQIASVEKTRENEFRELILKLKPAHMVAYLFVNYI